MDKLFSSDMIMIIGGLHRYNEMYEAIESHTLRKYISNYEQTLHTSI